MRRRDELERRLDAELRDHVERQVADYVAAGMQEQDARRRVRLEIGGLEQAKEHCRDVRPMQWLDELMRDMRIGFRGLRRDRVFAVSVVVILTLGIGASVTMFSMLDTVVLRPLPYAQPEQLAILTTQLMAESRPDGSSLPNIEDWRQQSRSFAGITYYRRTAASQVTYAGVDAPQRALEGLVGPDFFELLGTTPLLGRTLSPADFTGERLVVLSEGFWREQFGAAPDVVQRTLTIDNEPHAVIGVMPAVFQMPTATTRFWRPFSAAPIWKLLPGPRTSDLFEVVARLKSGVTLDDARAEMRVVAARLRAEHADNENLDVRVISLFDHLVGERTRSGVWLAFAAVLALLGIACANVGGLLSVRAARRRLEFDLRSALGAGRARLVRQLLAESLSLWTVAAVAGVLLAAAATRLLVAYGPTTIPRMEQVGLFAGAVSAALLGSLVVVVVFGMLPSLVVARLRHSLALGSRDGLAAPRHRLQDLLVTGQIAGSLVLVVGAALFMHSFVRAQGEDPGYPANDLVTVHIELPRQRYPDRVHLAAFFREAQRRINGLPGVVAVGAITDFFIRRNADQRVLIEGQPNVPNAARPRLSIEGVTPEYFRSTGIEVVEGRDFDERDAEPGAPRVVIVSESLARGFWPGESAVGKRMVPSSSPRQDGSWDTVVGVVRDMRREGLDVAPILSAFVPTYLRAMDLTVRTSTSLDSVIPGIRREIRAIDESLPLTAIARASGRLSERLGGRRFETQVLGIFAGVALLLAGAGLYALLAYQVTLRTRELGIRSALGANRQSIMSMVLTHGLRIVITGIAVGMVAAGAAARLLQSLLYQTAAIDVSSYAGATAFILLIAAIAAGLPALRAARIDPIAAIRET
jgi:predicted permease